MNPSTRLSPETIVAHAPCRVDLAGGTLDLWPLYLFHPGAVTVNFAVSVLTRCQITPLDSAEIHLKSIDTGKEEVFADYEALCKAKKVQHRLAAQVTRFFGPRRGFALETNSESPTGAGISGSSALMIATTAAMAKFTNQKLAKEQLRVLAQNLEAQLIRVPTGCQDYYPALYGGVSAIHLWPDAIHREQIPVAAEQIESRFLLIYTGAPRQSGINNWEVFKRHINGDRMVQKNFDEIASIARDMHVALAENQWDEVARLLHAEWSHRKANAPRITTKLIEKLVTAAKRKGARAAKVCGAGGGGCVILFVEQGAKAAVEKAITENGGRVVPFHVQQDGLTVIGGRSQAAAKA